MLQEFSTLSSIMIYDSVLRSHMQLVHAQRRKTYGSPKIHRKLRHSWILVSKNRVAGLMMFTNLPGLSKGHFRKITDVNHAFAPASDRLDRKSCVERIKQAWIGDMA
jgi:putative transposase